MRISLLQVPGLLMAVLILSCYPDYQQKEVKAELPLQKVISFGPRLIVYPAVDIELSQLVKMELLNGFQPGLTFEQAKEQLGKPDKVSSDRLGPYYAYYRSGGQVEVAWEEHRSGSNSYHTWTVRARPKNEQVAGFFHPSLVRYIDEAQDTYPQIEVTIMSSDHDNPALRARIERELVTFLTWLAPR